LMIFFITFIILFFFWMHLSGKFDIFHLTLGVISCALVSRSSGDLLFRQKTVRSTYLWQIFRFLKYLPWLLYQIVLANIHVAYLVLHPKMLTLIDPHIIRFKVKLKTDMGLTTFGNSITLTPGTITVLIHEGLFYVHAINQKVADDLLTGEMEDRVTQIYEEGNLGEFLSR
jgi:multicomponent Na+:H+ antiporter subunit E